MKEFLTENLFRGDLKGTVRNVISIDDFESVIDDDAIVLSFYFKIPDAAEDTSIFLERSHINAILDTEISKTTNKDGDTILFVEIDDSKRDTKERIERTNEVMQLMKNLSDIDQWYVKNLQHFGTSLKPFSESTLEALFKKIK